MTSTGRPTDAELNAYVDAELTPDEREAFEERLAGDPDAAARAAELQRLNDSIRSHYAAVLDEPVPEVMQALVSVTSTARAVPHWLRAAAAVALLLVGGTVGYVLRGYMETGNIDGASLVHNAVSAHSVYVSEVRHPVEVGAREETHLVKWLTKRTGVDIRAPVLTRHGFNLLGGRLLPFATGSAAQLMYENDGGRRLTIYVRRAGESENTAFKFVSERGLSAFYWIDAPLAYVIVAELPRTDLLAIARATYEQLD